MLEAIMHYDFACFQGTLAFLRSVIFIFCHASFTMEAIHLWPGGRVA